MAGHEDVLTEPKAMGNVKERNTELLINIAKLCNVPDRTYPEVVFLLGTSGVGKSAMVNTIVKALCGKYYSKAGTGKGNTSTKTLTLQSFKNCGFKDYEMEPLERAILQKGLSTLPTIIDANGKGDEDSDSLKDILRACFGGFVTPGTAIQYLEDLQSEHGIGSLQDLLKCSDENKVTKVVFVASFKQSFPEKLVDCLQSVLREYDDRSGKPKYPVDVFVVITKYDLVNDQKLYGARTSEEEGITEESFEEFEAKVASHCSIEGSTESNSIRWVSYVDGHGKDNPHIDNIALRFIEKMMQPRLGHDYGRPSKDAAANTRLVPWSNIQKLKAKRMVKKMKGYMDLKCLMILAILMVVLAVFYQLLTKKIE